MFRLLEMGRPEVRVGISAELAKSLAVGDERVVRADGRELSARVRALLPARNRETRTVDVVLTLEATENALRHGDLVEMELSQAIKKSGFWLPRSALTESSRGLWASYVAAPLPGSPSARAGDSPTHILKRRELELLYVDGDNVFVRGTLSSGELVVTEGLQRLIPDQRVARVKEWDR